MGHAGPGHRSVEKIEAKRQRFEADGFFVSLGKKPQPTVGELLRGYGLLEALSDAAEVNGKFSGGRGGCL